MAMTIVILTGTELRHEFFRKFLANQDAVKVLKTYCEGVQNNLAEQVKEQDQSSLRNAHLMAREETEKDFFKLYCESTTDLSNPDYIARKEINQDVHVEAIKKLNPDVIITYGWSIIKAPLIEAFKNRIVNIHLGLSPYYRGSGTNFWPFVNDEPEYVGVTFMYIDLGIDTGEIIHQIRPRIYPKDNIHQIGNRLISDMTLTTASIIRNFNTLQPMSQITSNTEKYYRNKDFTEDSVVQMYTNFSNGCVERFLETYEDRIANVPIITNPKIS